MRSRHIAVDSAQQEKSGTFQARYSSLLVWICDTLCFATNALKVHTQSSFLISTMQHNVLLWDDSL